MRITSPSRLLACLALGALVLSACGSDDDAADDEVFEAAATTTAADRSGSDDDVGADVAIADPWARATAPTASQGAGYMVLTAPDDDRLIGAAVDIEVAAAVEIHETVMTSDGDVDGDGGGMDGGGMDGGGMDGGGMGGDDLGGMGGDGSASGTMGGDDGGPGMADGMTMREIGEVVLPAGDAVVFEPGGLHLMFIDLVEPLTTGDTFEVTLQFELAGSQTVTFEVRDA